MLRLFFEAYDAVVLVDLSHAEADGFLDGSLDSGDGDIGLALVMPVEHFPVIHLINMIAG